MAADNTITLYDLQVSTGATISPFVWATKFAVTHKGFDLDIVEGGFTGILERTGGKTERLPAIVDDGKWVLDSWGIVEYLDQTYPDRPMLIPHESTAALTKALDAWFWGTAVGPWMRSFCADYRNVCYEHDKEYVTSTREVMLGGKLEDVQAGREDRLAPISASLEPLRMALREHAFLGGAEPNYADYRIMGGFLWLASVASTPALAADDPLRDWVERVRAMFGGLGNHPGLFEIFGLEQREGDPDPFNRQAGQGGIFKRNTGPASTSAETKRILKQD
ncbi:beta-etherase [Alteraurantiacibacter aquimixticola]|uniref:Glutathione S-transferase family protein n=1 Tax=Alteraurantiacibacter aquimixticola TaxID=2489173 RepID=A0A4T3F523_9SPHN|nr:beta-etherase [Alteraurantiacibacter aquimixticola]TIX51579.1 glutathione S-transferase family protein [Alteraurantiacibacter aquimixticola]